MLFSTALNTFLIAGASLTLATPVWPHYSVENEHLEVLAMRKSMAVSPSAAFDVECLDRNARIVFHDQNAAELAICGGIGGSATKCAGAPETTVGRSGSAQFTLRATAPGATINVSKLRWEQCVRAARGVCPTGSMRATCRGGATSGDVAFTLDLPSAGSELR
ncbi:hypothetical protein GGS23DRAFT_615592 [Durotheca rogersii]|uniref:uncharacterized protein n=1 Tax=Durotheca rogersii TaxID=419775 RepID=UPI00221FB01F|nr:uncharacterized protein GGS23DRAFT_615592 [Durotheca rogersii]KAI5866957.1 hypothetical protein GGS23DRAFT_615592 [Durotheca rogersii]